MNPFKRTVFEAALSLGNIFVVILTVPGLDLPPAHHFDGTVLEYGYSLAKPLPDLEVTDAGISATLSFGGQSTKTFVPWAAVVKIGQPGGFAALFPVEVEQFAPKARAVA
jgi:hypothetical protein